MCIRDRQYHAGKLAKHKIEKLNSIDFDWKGEQRLDYLPPCLLYTSDAADERSSVDLGGRRIIKKKNRKHVRGDIRLIKKKHTST